MSESLIELVNTNIANIEKFIFETKVVGTTFVQDSQRLLACLSQVDSSKLVIDLLREPKNQYDPNAVQVILGMSGKKNKYLIGYVGRDVSPFLTYILDGDKFRLSVLRVGIYGGTIGCNYGIKFEYRIFRR